MCLFVFPHVEVQLCMNVCSHVKMYNLKSPLISQKQHKLHFVCGVIFFTCITTVVLMLTNNNEKKNQIHMTLSFQEL